MLGANMLRITRDTQTAGSGPERFRLDGQVSGAWVEELRRACADALERSDRVGHRLSLDFGGVSFLDPAGVALCRELAIQGVSFTNCSIFVLEQLRGMVDVAP